MQNSAEIASKSSVHFASALLPEGWAANVRVVIAGGTVVSVERGVAAQSGDERASVGLPGLPNLHSHAFQRAMAGLTERRGPGPDSFWTWRELMYRFVARITPEDAEACAAQAYMEMLEAGFTRVGEFHYLHHDPAGRPYANPGEMAERIVAAAGRCGIGLTLLPVFYAHGAFGGKPPSEAQRRFITTLDQYARILETSRTLAKRLPHAITGVAPHSLRAVTADELHSVRHLGAGGPIHIHVAEQVREVEDCLAWCGMRPVEWLLNSAPVDRNWCIVHATHVNESEVARLAASGAVAGLCPVTEANLGDGVFPATDFVAAGGRFGIGTDSNVRISASEELRQLEYSQRLRAHLRNALASGAHCSTGRSLYEAALAGGSLALGVTGGIKPGTPADMISLATEDVSFANREGDQWLDTFIFAGAQHCIDTVWCAGRRVVKDGRHHARPEIEARFRAALSRLLRA